MGLGAFFLWKARGPPGCGAMICQTSWSASCSARPTRCAARQARSAPPHDQHRFACLNTRRGVCSVQADDGHPPEQSPAAGAGSTMRQLCAQTGVLQSELCQQAPTEPGFETRLLIHITLAHDIGRLNSGYAVASRAMESHSKACWEWCSRHSSCAAVQGMPRWRRCQAASGGAWPSRARCCPRRTSCCWTSPPTTWTRRWPTES